MFVQFGDKLLELLKGCVWAVTFGPPCIGTQNHESWFRTCLIKALTHFII